MKGSARDTRGTGERKVGIVSRHANGNQNVIGGVNIDNGSGKVLVAYTLDGDGTVSVFDTGLTQLTTEPITSNDGTSFVNLRLLGGKPRLNPTRVPTHIKGLVPVFLHFLYRFCSSETASAVEHHFFVFRCVF